MSVIFAPSIMTSYAAIPIKNIVFNGWSDFFIICDDVFMHTR